MSVIPSGSVIAQRYRYYRAGLPALCERLQLNPRRLTFTDDVILVTAWLAENPWAPPDGGGKAQRFQGSKAPLSL